MKTKTLPACLAISVASVFAQTQTELRNAYSVTGSTKLTDGTTMMFRLMVPKNYDPSKKYPIVLHMHGIGERGNNNTSQLSYEIAKPWVSDSVQRKWSPFALAPQCPANGVWAGTAGEGAVKVLDSLKNVYSLDTTRFYIGGLSWGGIGTWHLIQKYPNKFAAAIPHAGNGSSNGATLAKTPFWAWHGDADATVNVSGSRNMVTAVENAGFPVVKFYSGKNLANPTGISVDSLKRAVGTGKKYLYSEIKSGDHSAGCDEGWKTAMMPGWLFSKAKVNGQSVVWDPNPVSIAFPGRALSNVHPNGNPIQPSWTGHSLTLRSGNPMRRVTLSSLNGRVWVDREVSASEVVFHLPALRPGAYIAKVDHYPGIPLLVKNP